MIWKKINEQYSPTTIQRFKIYLDGYVYINEYDQKIQMSVIKCPIHGFMKTRAYGFSQRLPCPMCERGNRHAQKI